MDIAKIIRKYLRYLLRKKHVSKVAIRNIGTCSSDTGTLDDSVEKFDWVETIVDGLIISGLAFFGSLGGGSIAGLDFMLALESSIISTGIQFFIFLALRRGIGQTKKFSTKHSLIAENRRRSVLFHCTFWNTFANVTPFKLSIA